MCRWRDDRQWNTGPRGLLGRLRGGLLRRRGLLRGRPVRGPVRLGLVAFDAAPHFFAAGFLTAGFLALAAGFLAAGFRLAAAMADVSPVPSEGALAVDSRAAAPHAPGPVPRASLPPHRARHGPLVRRRGATAIGPTTRRRVAVDAPRKGSAAGAPHRGLVWGCSAMCSGKLRRGPTV